MSDVGNVRCALRGLLLVLSSGIAALSSTTAFADQEQVVAQRAWRQQTDCERDAIKQYPDYTKDSLAARDRAVRRCLAVRHLTPRPDQSVRENVPPAASGGDRGQ